MDSKIKNMLIVAMEESAEIAQACSKAIRFGLLGHHPNKSKNQNHAHEILVEYYQLQAIIEKLQHDKLLPYYSEEYIANIKRNKLSKTKKHYEANKNNRRKC